MTGNKFIDTILVGVSTVAAAGAFGVFIYSEVLYNRELPDDTAEELALMEEAKNQTFSETFKLEKVIVNLQSPGRRLRFLDTELHLVPFKNEKLPLLEEKKSHILDLVLSTAGAMTPNELNSISGKILLENRLKERINKLFPKKAIKEIYFSKFVIQ